MKDSKGFVQLNRAILDWEWYKSKNEYKLFLHCLLKANYEDKQWQNICIKRGSFITSREHLASETGMSVQNVRTALKNLILTKYLTKLTTAKYTVITVIDYDNFTKLTSKSTSKLTTTNKSNKYNEYRSF